MDFIIAAILLAALLVAVVTDVRGQRIPNLLTFPLILAGLGLHTATGGLDGLLFSLGGFGLGLGVMLIPFLMGVMGAGDVKLMAGVGACLGVETAFIAFLVTCLAGGVYALGMLLRHMDHLKAILANFRYTILAFLTTRTVEYTPVTPEGSLPRLCYGVAIAAGTVTAMALTMIETGAPFAR